VASIEAIKRAIVDKEEELKQKVSTENIIKRELKITEISTDVARILLV
jgi:hypothetical protein